MKPREWTPNSTQHTARYSQKSRANPKPSQKLKAAERVWIAYRDAYIDATYPAEDKATEYGSIYPLDVNLLRAKLTRRQVAALEDMLLHYTPK
jgi:uncharacterized protein YecT (DUF1311 family)